MKIGEKLLVATIETMLENPDLKKVAWAALQTLTGNA
jgi:hypothetical protein